MSLFGVLARAPPPLLPTPRFSLSIHKAEEREIKRKRKLVIHEGREKLRTEGVRKKRNVCKHHFLIFSLFPKFARLISSHYIFRSVISFVISFRGIVFCLVFSRRVPPLLPSSPHAPGTRKAMSQDNKKNNLLKKINEQWRASGRRGTFVTLFFDLLFSPSLYDFPPIRSFAP